MEIPENHIGSVPNFFEQQWFHSHGAGSQEGVQNYMPALASTQEAQHPVESIMKLHTPLHIWFMWMITQFRPGGVWNELADFSGCIPGSSSGREVCRRLWLEVVLAKGCR